MLRGRALYKVISAIIDFREFTVSEICSVTRAGGEEISSEEVSSFMEALRDDGFLTSEPMPSSPGKKRFRYFVRPERLTDLFEKIREVGKRLMTN